MKARLLAFVIWAAVAASAVFWLLRLWSSSPSAPAHTVVVGAGPSQRSDLTKVLGAPPAAPSAQRSTPSEPALASRFKLLGVAAPRDKSDGAGIALIAVDGKPARGFHVGARVDGELVLQSVHARGASIGPNGGNASVSLELPPVPFASAAVRGSVGGASPIAAPVAPPPAGAFAPVPTAVVPPPPATVPPTGLRPPEQGEPTGEAPPAQPGALTR